MGLFKRGNVYWSYVWVDGIRHAKSTGATNRRTAERIDQRFKEELNLARTHAWQERSAQLAPRSAETDILGALLVASEVFHASPSGHRKVLVVLSDMKQATRSLNLEHQSMVQTPAAMRQVANNRLLADLRGVDVYAEGVDAAGESVGYWQGLHDFWTAYFVQAGATLARYSALREVSEFERPSQP